MDSPTDQLPTRHTRQINFQTVTYVTKSSGSLVTRDIHANETIIDRTKDYSRAKIEELSVMFIPQPTSVGLAVVLHVAWTHGNKSAANLADMMALPGYHCFSFGNSFGITPVLEYKCDFDLSLAAPFVKPIPVEGARPRLIILAVYSKMVEGSVRSLTTAEKEAADQVFVAIVKAKISLHGSA